MSGRAGKNRLPMRSKKMKALYVDRRRLVARMLSETPICDRCHAERATEIHEVLTRARGGSVVDEANCRALCHACHLHITENPAESLREGWIRSSWDKT
jgi:hypothetical protein